MPPDLRAEIDPDQMFRVFSNLLRNAAQALAEHGAKDGSAPRVTVSAERAGARIVIRVADNGPGLPPRARDSLFEAFSGSAAAGGTGLGLAIAAELVRLHGGEIALEESEVGAVFRVEV